MNCYYLDKEAINFINEYIIDVYKNDKDYIQNNKNGLIATIKQLDKKLNEYYLLIKKSEKQLAFYSNKKEAYKSIKYNILYNGIITEGGTTKDALYYEISAIIDNNNMELYNDIIKVYKAYINDYKRRIERDKQYLNDFNKIKKELLKMIIKVA